MDFADTDIAIVGISARFPGSPDADAYWKSLRDGVESIRSYSDEELVAAGVPASEVARSNYVKAGAPLEEMEWFDAGFFGFGPKDAAVLDPQHRHFLECSWEALEDSGTRPATFPGSIGVFAGVGMQSYFIFNLLTNREVMDTMGLFLVRHTGNDKDFLPTRVSYCLDLRGPSVSVQTACSTSLVAVHLAVQSLINGECDLALAGGATIEVPHRHGYLFKEQEILSPDGHCRSFDASSRGTVFGSGIGVVALRRLSDAVEDGDPVHAVIKGSAINNDGSQKIGYLAPSVDGQAAVILEALSLADLSPEDIGYVETHGTGTPVGDPIEVAALTQAFRSQTDRRQFCAIGSVKSNIGHTDTAAGVAGLIKVVQALRHEMLPPSLHFESPNPACAFETSPFFVNDRLREWPRSSSPRRAGVSSLGVGGTNAHVILEEAPVLPATPPDDSWELLVFSGKTVTSAERNAERLAAHLEEHPDLHLGNVAYTYQVGREPFGHRRAVACRDGADAISAIRDGGAKRIATGTAPETEAAVVFMFPGGGAQYPQMGRDLYDALPVYRESVDRCLETLAGLVDADLRALMFPADGADVEAAAEQLRRPLLALPTLFATEYALAQLWMSWGVEPAAMTGHSMGEYTAACLAGVFTLEDALRVVTLRGRLFETLPPGGMLSVPMAEDAVRPLLGDELSIAAINGPELCVVSGGDAAIERAAERFEAKEIEFRRLKIDVAAHSSELEPILEEFRRGVGELSLSAPERPFVSNVSGTWARPEEVVTPEYWVQHLRRTVRFADGLSTILRQGPQALIEIGPGTTLGSLARMHPDRRTSDPVASSLRHPQESVDDRQFLLSNLGQLWCSGMAVDWLKFQGERERRRLSLPTYAFDRQRYWIEPGEPVARVEADDTAITKLPALEDWLQRPAWRVAGLANVEDDLAKRWLVFLDAAGVGSEVVRALRARGADVVTVREGDAFYEVGTEEFILAPEHGAEGYRLMLERLAEREWTPDEIVHLWLLTERESYRPGSNFFHRNQEQGFYSLLFLSQELSDRWLESPCGLTVVSTGMQRLGDETLAYPEKATALGPVRVIPNEFPLVRCRSFDVDLPAPRRRRAAGARFSALAEALIDEIRAGEDPEVALRGESRYVKTYEPLHLEPAKAEESRLRKGGVYLITGGLGGIGMAVAQYLAEHWQARLVLVGRSGLPERSAWDRWLGTHSERDPKSLGIRAVRELERTGAEVLVGVADVANPEQMNAVIAEANERFGPIQGVVHAAGNLDDAIIPSKTQEQIENVFSPKVHGTLVLTNLFAETALDFFVFFSSTSTILGPAGQVDYTAANCFLNALAESQRSVGRDRDSGGTFAVQWGVWNEVGMARALSRRIGQPDAEFFTARELLPHPLLDERLVTASGDIAYGATYSAESRWIIAEHRTRAGQMLVPGTAFLELARASYEDSRRSPECELKNVSFLVPLEVKEGAEREVRVELTRSDGDFSFSIRSRRSVEHPWTLHVEGGCAALASEVPGPLDLSSISERCRDVVLDEGGDALRTDQEEFLDFGPRWAVLRRAEFGRGEALARIELAPEYESEVGSFGLHPALLDIATGFALRLVEGYAPGRNLYVPVSYDRVRVYRRLPASFHSWMRPVETYTTDDDVVAFDVTLVDGEGRALVEVEGFRMKRLDTALLLPPESYASEAQLSAAERFFMTTFDAGIDVREGMEALARVLSGSTGAQIIVSSIDLDALRAGMERARESEGAGETQVKFARPNLSSEYEAPRDEVETALVAHWEELLGVDQLGVHDDFFEVGGHSLVAVRLFAKIKKEFGVELPLSVLFEAPTIAGCADIIRAQTGDREASGAGGTFRSAHKFLVPMRTVDDAKKPPFFIVAGMFGNVLNLRYLASRLGDDQPVYAVQAKGLYGDDQPHTRFEDMARDYLEEIRTVQPEGPYFLGGFSGGGITAFEMAQQLRAAGEDVGILVMLDSFPPEIPSLDWGDRLRIQAQRLSRQGVSYVFTWAKNRAQWEWKKITRRFGEAEEELTPAEFRSTQIEAAFYDALAHYDVTDYPGKVILFRPKLDESHRLSGGRVANKDRRLVDPTNHWAPYVSGGIEVHEVVGDHDSMVLEPNVRVLAKNLRAAVEEAQLAWAVAASPETAAERSVVEPAR